MTKTASKCAARILGSTLLLLSFLVPGCREGAPPEAGEVGPPMPGTAGPTEALPAPAAGERADSGAGAGVFAWIDGDPVTVADLKRFENEQGISAEGHGRMRHKDPLLVLRAYVRYHAFMQQALAWGLEKSPDLTHPLRGQKLLALGIRYRNHLIRTAVLPPDAFKPYIPTKWTRMSFALYAFDTEENARRAREGLKGADETPGDDLPGRVPIMGKMVSVVEKIFPGSSRFDPFDDPYLFTLRKGELSRPVKTGIGPVLARVLDRKDLSSAEVDSYLAEIRAFLADQQGNAKAGEIIGAAQIRIDDKALGKALDEHLGGGTKSRATVATVGDFPVSYRFFLEAGKPNLTLITTKPRNSWLVYLRRDLDSLCSILALGRAGEEARFLTPEDERNVARDLEIARGRLLSELTQERFWDQAKVPPATEAEMRALYEKDKERFLVKEALHIQYYFTPQAAALEEMSRRSEQGAPFEKLSTGMERKTGSPHEGLKLTDRRIVKGSKDLGTLQEALFTLAKGDIRLIPVDMGYYLVRIVEKQAPRQRPFEEVKDYLARTIEGERRKAAAEKEIAALVDKVSVKLAGEEIEEQKGIPMRGDGGRT